MQVDKSKGLVEVQPAIVVPITTHDFPAPVFHAAQFNQAVSFNKNTVLTMQPNQIIVMSLLRTPTHIYWLFLMITPRML